MPTPLQDIAVIDYDGPQGSRELEMVESISLPRNKPRTRAKTMNRDRRAVGFQSGTKEVSITLTVVPELVEPEVDWVQALDADEVFELTVERGLGGAREHLIDCMVSDVNDSFSESGEARQEVTVEALLSGVEPT